VGRVVPTSQRWTPRGQGIYPPMSNISGLVGGSFDPSRQPTLQLGDPRVGLLDAPAASDGGPEILGWPASQPVNVLECFTTKTRGSRVMPAQDIS
jgi:hypothetical protein